MLAELTAFVTDNPDRNVEINLACWADCLMCYPATPEEATTARRILSGDIAVSENDDAPAWRLVKSREESLRDEIEAIKQRLPFQDGQGYYDQKRKLQELQHALQKLRA